MTIAFLLGCLALVLCFEFSNGFHDAANAVATVIYTNSLRPVPAVIWSGIMNFLGVMLGGIAVAYALVEIIPPEVLTPPNGGIAIGMLAALFLSALTWNVGTWWFAIPNSSSHALIGSLVGIAVENSLTGGRGLEHGVDWHQIWQVLLSLVLSPVMGFFLAFLLFGAVKALIRVPSLYEPPKDGEAPVWWMRTILILTCTGVSFAHGTNDGQKSIGLIMLTIIGLLPVTYALNTEATAGQVAKLAQEMPAAQSLIGRFGDDQKQIGAEAAKTRGEKLAHAKTIADIPAADRIATRNDANHVLAELRTASEAKHISETEKHQAKAIHDELMKAVEYAPSWVRILSALCLSVGTMIGYRRIVTTLGSRLGKQHLVPAQGASAELVAALLIGGAGFTGFPVSTTHVVTGGISGTMAASGAGLQMSTVWQIATAWILTLPATIALSAILFHILK
jgi:inorganic phosphate transporter, PiT family